MDAALSTERSGDSLSTAIPAWTNLTLAENQGAELSTSALIFTDFHSGSSVASRTTDDQFHAQSSEIPVHMENVKTETGVTSLPDDLTLSSNNFESNTAAEMSLEDTSTSSSDDLTLTTDHLLLGSIAEMSLKGTWSSNDLTLTSHHLQSDSIVETNLKESKTSSAQNVGIPIEVVSGFRLETTVKTETEKLLMTSMDITTAVPLSDQIMHTPQPQNVSQTHISEDALKTLVFRDTTAARDTSHVSSSFKTTPSFRFSKALQSSVTSTLQKSLAVAVKTQTESSRNQSLPARLQFTAVHDTTSQSSVASGVRLIDEYTSAVNHSGEYCSANQPKHITTLCVMLQNNLSYTNDPM